MYSYYRRFRSIGRIRAWYAAKADRRTWDEETYPPPPEMRYPGTALIVGPRGWEVTPSYIKVNRYSFSRGIIIDSQNKVKRLHKRRKARRYRAYQRRTGRL